MNNIDFSRIKTFSKLFQAFIKNQSEALERFPNNTGQTSYINNKSCPANYKLIEAFRASMPEMSDLQKENLVKLEAGALCITTGQQPGFLGGPLYGIYKAETAVALSKRYSSEYPNKEFVPVFWVEDNDHDAHEAAAATILTKEKKPLKIYTGGYSLGDRIITAERIYDDLIKDKLNIVLDNLKETLYTDELRKALFNCYSPGSSWSAAFVKLMNFFLPSSGILYLSANEVRKAGLFKGIMMKELAFPGKTLDLINKGSSILDNYGYHIQAKAFYFNVFLHEDNKRYKIEETKEGYLKAGDKTMTLQELREIALNNPEQFSPQVLLRPLMQDNVLPTAAYVGGPSEIAYLAQLKELYQDFNVDFPIVLHRLSATIIDRKTKTFLEKANEEIDSLFMEKYELDKKLSDELEDKEVKAVLEEVKNKIDVSLAPALDLAAKISTSILQSAEAAKHKILKEADALEKRISSAYKRDKQEERDKNLNAWHFLYPNGSLQERTFSPVTFINMIGRDAFETLIKEHAEDYVQRLDNCCHRVIQI